MYDNPAEAEKAAVARSQRIGKERGSEAGETPGEVSDGVVQENGKWLEYKNGKKIYTWPSKESYDNYQNAIGKKR